MTTYAVELRRSPTITDVERRRRLSRVYSMLIELGRKSNSDAPASETGEPGAGASDADHEGRRRAHGTPSAAVAQVGGVV